MPEGQEVSLMGVDWEVGHWRQGIWVPLQAEQGFSFTFPHLPLSGLVSFPHDQELVEMVKYKMCAGNVGTKPAWTVPDFSTNMSELGVTYPLTRQGGRRVNSRGCMCPWG